MCSQTQYNIFNSFQAVKYACVYSFNIIAFLQMSLTNQDVEAT